jgi:hypothetical protein
MMYLKVHNSNGKLLALHANIRLGWKDLPETYALAYSGAIHWLIKNILWHFRQKDSVETVFKANLNQVLKNG